MISTLVEGGLRNSPVTSPAIAGVALGKMAAQG